MSSAIDSSTGVWGSPFVLAIGSLPFVGSVVSLVAMSNLKTAVGHLDSDSNPKKALLDGARIYDLLTKYASAAAISKITTVALLIGMLALKIIQSPLFCILFAFGSLLWMGYDSLKMAEYNDYSIRLYNQVETLMNRRG